METPTYFAFPFIWRSRLHKKNHLGIRVHPIYWKNLLFDLQPDWLISLWKPLLWIVVQTPCLSSIFNWKFRKGAKFIETGAWHSGTGAVTFFNTVNHGALTFFIWKITGCKLFCNQKITGQEIIFNCKITGCLLFNSISCGYFLHRLVTFLKIC